MGGQSWLTQGANRGQLMRGTGIQITPEMLYGPLPSVTWLHAVQSIWVYSGAEFVPRQSAYLPHHLLNMGKKVPQNAQRNRKDQRSRGDRILAQGAMCTTKRPFGSASPSTKKTWAALSGRLVTEGLCALSPVHLPLPRPVAPYTVVRTTSIVETGQRNIFVGLFQDAANDHEWNDALLYSSNNNSTAFDDTFTPAGNVPFDFGSQSVVVPAAITVQFMCPDPLQTAHGVAYSGRMTQRVKPLGVAGTASSVMQSITSVNCPRVLTGAKLALRGVCSDLLPGDMAELSNFRPLVSRTTPTNVFSSVGFMPVFVYNPDEIPLRFLITVEWRVRFGALQAAAASHSYHAPAPLSLWDQVVAAGSSVGHGIADIAEYVANNGEKVMAAAQLAAKLAPK